MTGEQKTLEPERLRALLLADLQGVVACTSREASLEPAVVSAFERIGVRAGCSLADALAAALLVLELRLRRQADSQLLIVATEAPGPRLVSFILLGIETFDALCLEVAKAIRSTAPASAEDELIAVAQIGGMPAAARVGVVSGRESPSPLELVVRIEPRRASLQYDPRFVSDRQADAYAEALGQLALQGLERPDAPVSELNLLSAVGQESVLAAGHGGKQEGPPLTVTSLLERAFVTHPDRTAVSESLRTLTYRQLDEQSTQLAHLLRDQQGVVMGDIIGLCLPRRLELIVAICASLKLGCGYLSLDPSYPRERLESILTDARPKLVIGSADAPLAGDWLVWDKRLTEDLGELSREWGPSAVSPEAPCYVIYTSGSTGVPKGVLVPQRAVANMLLNEVELMGYSPRDVKLQRSTINFDASVREILVALIVGCELTLAPDNMLDSFSRFVAVLAERRVTILHLPAQLWHQWVMAAPACPPPPSVRAVSVGGDRMRADLLDRWFKLAPGVDLVNRYGPTEASVHTSTHRIELADADSSIPIGRPLRGTEFRVVDEWGSLLPLGFAGELWIGGRGLAHGYIGRPAMTAEKFVPASDGHRFYRSGDLVCWREDGVLEFIGRIDTQVKISGYRIELAEIEQALSRHQHVHTAVVITHERQSGDRFLVCYFTPKHGLEPSASDLRAHLKALVPDYMIPAQFIALSPLPLTASGKIDRRALPPPRRRQLPALSPLGESLAAIVASVSDWVPAADDSLIDTLGMAGSATFASAAAREGIPVTLEDIVRHRTIRALTALYEP